MTFRATQDQIISMVNLVNKMSKTKYGIIQGYAYGKCQLYLYDTERKAYITHWFTGTKTECWYYLQAIVRALEYYVPMLLDEL